MAILAPFFFASLIKLEDISITLEDISVTLGVGDVCKNILSTLSKALEMVSAVDQRKLFQKY